MTGAERFFYEPSNGARMRWFVAVACLSLILSGCASKTAESDTASDSEAGSSSKAQASAGGSASKAASASGTASGSKAPASTATGTAAASNKAPTITAFAAEVTGLNATFAFAATDANNDTLTYTLSFGDGSVNATGTLPSANVTYAFAAAGNYTAQLIVSDGKLAGNKTLLVSMVAAAVAAVDPFAHCNRPDADELPGGLYVDARQLPSPTAPDSYSVWIYEESNGTPGLQAGGAGEEAAFIDCPNPDTLIF